MKRLVRDYPLRVVVERLEAPDGWPIDLLECGHQKPVQAYWETHNKLRFSYAARRRCSDCGPREVA